MNAIATSCYTRLVAVLAVAVLVAAVVGYLPGPSYG